MAQRSLIHQAVAVVLVAQVFCALALSAVAFQHERSSRLRAFDVQIQGRSDSLLGAIQDAEDPADNVTIDPRELRLPTQDIYAVYNQDGRKIGTSAHAPAALTTPGSDGYRDLNDGKTTYRLYQRKAMRIIDRAESGGVGLSRPVVILYASPKTYLWYEILEAASFYLVSIAVAALLTVGALVILLQRVMSPLPELAAAACRISAPSLAFDPPAAVLEIRELRPLAQVLASVVSGLREAFEREHRFVGDAAHELKTAVAVVRSTVQVLMMRPRTAEEYAAGLERVLEDNSRVEKLVSRMLELAQAEEPASNHARNIDLGRIATEAVAHLDSMAKMRGIDLRCHADHGRVKLIPERALLLITNLVENAIQHSHPGMLVDISVRPMKDVVILEIADSGAGIRADALPHVFDRFYREDESRSRQTGGAGLGLAICKSIVDAAGGTIGIVSEPGKGTTVTVTFIQA